MPGHNGVCRSCVKNPVLFDKYQCPRCELLLKNAVQPSCGHWLCECCAQELLQSFSPKCPRPDCLEDLKADEVEGAEPLYFFPDRFVRREIEGMVISCPHYKKGCDWEGKVAQLDKHLLNCSFSSLECEDCGKALSPDEMKSHKQTCPMTMMKCPLAIYGCQHKKEVTRENLQKHVADNEVEHLQIVAGVLQDYDNRISSKQDIKPISSKQEIKPLIVPDHDFEATGQAVCRNGDDTVENDYVHSSPQRVRPKGHRVQPDGPRVVTDNGQLASLNSSTSDWNGPIQVHTLKRSISEVETKFAADLKKKDEEISSLRSTITKLEKAMRSKHAEFEDRDFRLSLIENSNHDGSMIWKIPQFSQRMADAQTGRYTSIFSLPFYTGRYGYKMCLRLYILGDGIGKNTHMSLFFVVMKGEFDNILQWPFTHKVTFKLINQTGGRDIIDTFQPDPMSSSFRKPKSDMNIASGCPRFASHTELKNGGFILEDTVFVKCSIDTTTVKNP